MTPRASTPAALARMRRQRRRDTKPEMSLRRELHHRGFRFRVNTSVFDSRRRHDVVFTKARVVVEVRGCFWHACPIHGTSPKSNAKWWADKLEANRQRDEDTARRLAGAGWKLLVVWEHDDPVEAADRVECCLRHETTPVEVPGSDSFYEHSSDREKANPE